jgi:predicted glycoside hydrolase/deacetylase ChbG (UPF0249 family)
MKSHAHLSVLATFWILGALFPACSEYPFPAHESIQRYEETRYLIVTADDFGAADCVDEAFWIGTQQGLVNTISAMSNFAGAPEKIKALHERDSSLAIGLHLNITTGRPLLDQARVPSLVSENGSFYPIAEIMCQLPEIDLGELEQELRAQITAFLQTGVPMDHLSYQHHILALYSPFFDLVIELAMEYQVPLRNPMSISVADERFADAGTRAVGTQLARKMAFRCPFAASRMMKYTEEEEVARNCQKLTDRGIDFPDHTIDYVYGDPSGHNILFILNHLPPGTSELIFHLGKPCDPEQIDPKMNLDLPYLPLREQELVIATSGYLRELLKEKNIEIIGFQDLPLDIPQTAFNRFD